MDNFAKGIRETVRLSGIGIDISDVKDEVLVVSTSLLFVTLLASVFILVTSFEKKPLKKVVASSSPKSNKKQPEVKPKQAETKPKQPEPKPKITPKEKDKLVPSAKKVEQPEKKKVVPMEVPKVETNSEQSSESDSEMFPEHVNGSTKKRPPRKRKTKKAADVTEPASTVSTDKKKKQSPDSDTAQQTPVEPGWERVATKKKKNKKGEDAKEL